jgi:putative FmdB family regulatory protein
MPLREYDCPRCGTFEVLQKHSDEPLEHHEPCGSKVERKMSLSSFSLKGGGWYSDGYASAGAGCSTGGCAGGSCALPGE